MEAQRASPPEKNTLDQMLRSPIPKIYANGFLAGRSHTDLFIISTLNGSPLTVMNMSFTSAKMLRDLLGKMIKDIEEKTGQEIKAVPLGK